MKLSVVVITYNHERFISQALSSILSQRVNFEYEIIVAEDCSTDGTRANVTDFARRHPDKIISLPRNRNLGMMRNFREALSACRGEYVAILEGDDYWIRDDKLQMQIEFLDAHPDHAICCARARFIDEIGGGQSYVLPGSPAGSYTIMDLFEANLIATCTVMYRWGNIGALPSWVFKLKMADWPLHILVGRLGKIYLMDEVMSAYRIHSGGAWSSLSPVEQLAAIKQMLRALDKHLSFQPANAIQRAISNKTEAIARLYLEMAQTARFNGERMATASCLLGCLRNGGWQLLGNRRLLVGLAAYAVIGAKYKVFSRAKANLTS